MELSAAQALVWTKRLLGGAIALQALELWWVRAAFRDEGVFRWSVLREEFRDLPAPLRAVLDRLLGYRGFLGLLVVQLLAAVALISLQSPAPARLLLVTTWLLCLRFRGTYNGGSDAMTWAILLGLAIAEGASALRVVGLGYIAAQLLLSYFVAGVAKLREPSWRRGHALSELARARQYALPIWARRLSEGPGGAFACWLVLGFECSFPLALTSPALCIGLLSLALVFHIANALVLGLNRFLWAWLAAYPALFYWSQTARP